MSNVYLDETDLVFWLRVAMVIKLFHAEASPPSRAVRLTARALGVDLTLVPMKMLEREHLSPGYIEMNPMHTVPLLDDNGFMIIDSHAIITYLADKYGKTDKLYPKDIETRCEVDQILYFDCGILFPRLKNIALPVLLHGERTISQGKKEAVLEGYDFLDRLLKNKKWMTGNDMTIADFSCVATVSGLNFMVPGLEKRKNVTAWLNRCKEEMDGYQEINQTGTDLLEKAVMSRIVN